MNYDNEAIEEEYYEPGAVENVQETIGAIIKSLDKFETIVQQVSNNIKRKMRTTQQPTNAAPVALPETEGVIETHFVLERDNEFETECELRFPLQTLPELEKVNDPIFVDVVANFLQKLVRDCEYNISAVLSQVLTDHLVNQLTWEEEETEAGRIPLQSFSFFSSQLYDLVKEKYTHDQYLLELRKVVFKVHKRCEENSS